jgi:hypothetical protein
LAVVSPWRVLPGVDALDLVAEFKVLFHFEVFGAIVLSLAIKGRVKMA